MTNRQQLSELYVSILGRAPDAAGLNYWVNQLEQGLSLGQIGSNWMNSQPEVISKYADLSATDFISSIYHNVLGRSPDSDGQAYWLARLEQGQIPRESFINAIIAGAKAPTSGAADAALLANRAEIGLRFAELNLHFGGLAADIIQLATADPASVTLAQAVMALAPAPAESANADAANSLGQLIHDLAQTIGITPTTLGNLTSYLHAIVSEMASTTSSDWNAIIAAATTTASNAATQPSLLDDVTALAQTTVTAPGTITNGPSTSNTGNAGGNTTNASNSVWAHELNGSVADLAPLAAEKTAVTLRVDPRFGGYVSIDGFGADDTLQFPSGSSAVISVTSSGSNVSLVSNYNGVVTHIELKGISSPTALVYDTLSFNALPVGDISYTGTTFSTKSSNLDLSAGSFSAPYVIDASIGAFSFTDSAMLPSVTRIAGFGNDDRIAFSQLASLHDIAVSSQAGDVTMTVNQAGTVSTVTLVGVSNTEQIIYDIASFNALPVGDIVLS